MNKIINDDIKSIVNTLHKDIAWFNGKTFIIFGVTGLIGEYLVKTFNSLVMAGIDIKVYGFARNVEKIELLAGEIDSINRNIFFESADIRDYSMVNSICKFEKIDYIFHVACPTNPIAYDAIPVDVMETNFLGALNIERTIRENHLETEVLFVSSSSVYGFIKNMDLVDEDSFGKLDPLMERACYSESKRATETLLKAFWIQYGIRFKIVRCRRVIGPQLLNDGSFLGDIFKSILIDKDERVVAFHSDTLIQPIYISDVITGIFMVLIYGNNTEAYNIAGNEQVMVDDIIDIINKRYGDIIEYYDRDEIFPASRLGKSSVNNGKVLSEKLQKLGWNLKYNSRDTIERELEYIDSISGII